MRFRGPKGELPKGKDGSYATSLPLWKCMWDGSDVIMAWKQNGRILDPDHGFPVGALYFPITYPPPSSPSPSPSSSCASASPNCTQKHQIPFDHSSHASEIRERRRRVQVRMIIPGHIGGRMVKWLEEVEVAASESDNHYHYMDNRVLPSHVDEALAKEEGTPCSVMSLCLALPSKKPVKICP